MADETVNEAPAPATPSRRALAEENDSLREENEQLRRELARKKAEAGPPVGTVVCYQRAGEGFCRPAKVASEGFTELVKHQSGNPDMAKRHALIEYGESPWTIQGGAPDHMKVHTFQVDRPWDPLGHPETWHVPDECPRARESGCPFAPNPHWPPRPPEAP